MQELVIKVPAPFAGIDELGFSTRYPEQRLDEPLRDVTFFVEGLPELVGTLRPYLERFPRQSRRAGLGYLWTDPVLISDELLVIAFRDRSVEMLEPADVARRYFVNLIQPLVIPFLRDCVQIADLRLASEIELSMVRDESVLAEFALRLEQLIPQNGSVVLSA
jgi:hypothetical protein